MSIFLPDTDIQTLHKGVPRSAQAVSAVKTVEHLVSLKARSGSDPWPVIEECLNIWADSNPERFRSFLYGIEETKETRSDAKYGLSKTGAFRYTLDIPEKVMYMIRCLYTDDELPMDKEFFHSWARRFPKMKIAERN